MKPITTENRKLIVAAKERGETPEAIAVWFGAAVSSIYNILALHRKTNNIEPKPFPGRPSRLTEEHLDKIRTKVKSQNDITLDELIEELNLPIKKSRLSQVLTEMDLPFKKRRSMQTGNSEKMCKKKEKN